MNAQAVAIAERKLPEFYTVPRVLDLANKNQDAECGLTFENERDLRLHIMSELGLNDHDGGHNSISVTNAIRKAAMNLFLAQYY